jgi:hypothetical protein
MSDGRPDIEGVWNHATLTSLERPAQFDNILHTARGQEGAIK